MSFSFHSCQIRQHRILSVYSGLLLVLMWFLLAIPALKAAEVAYVHGDISECGVTPASADTSCSTEPYDQMLLNDSGSKGLSQFKALLQGQGHSIAQFYDQNTTLSTAWLNNHDVIIFGLHQKIWSAVERQALDRWLQDGGGMFIYSDSASGGFFQRVGAQNPIGQMVTNNLIADYGMQVTVDQADGTTGQVASGTASIPGVAGKVLEGEGVSPAAIARDETDVEVLIPYTRAVNKRQGLTIDDPVFASLAMATVGAGHIVVMFDRQPMWNNGPGSDINEEDNRAILRDVINFLSIRPMSTNPNPPAVGSATLSPVYLLLDDD